MFKSLMLGSKLEKPEFWKKVQLYITMAATLVPVAAAFIPAAQVLIDKDVMGQTLSAVIAVNAYLTLATTEKIGL